MDKNASYEIKHAPKMFEQVAQQIIHYIHSEQLTPGSKIPTERTLSDLLGVGRSTIREGIRVLTLLQYLESRQGEGTFVSEAPPFIVPCGMLNQPPDAVSFKHYYGVFLMCSRQIVMSALRDPSLRKQDPLDASAGQDRNFWDSLSAWVQQLGGRLDNPFILALWSDTRKIIMDRLLSSDPSIPFQTLADAYLAKDEAELNRLFDSIAGANG